MERLTVRKPRALLLMGLTILVCLSLTLTETRAADFEPAARYGPVKVTDTLWTIASRHRPEPELSVQQTMLAIVALNPEAFRDGNIHHMYTGYYLDIPSADMIARMDEAQARDLIEQQRHDGPGLASAEIEQLQESAGTAHSREADTADRSSAERDQAAATEAAVAEAEEAAADQVAELRQELSRATQTTEQLEQENRELQNQLSDLSSLVEELQEEAAAADALNHELERLRAEQRGQDQEQAVGALVLKWLSWPWVMIPAVVLLIILLGLWRALRFQSERTPEGQSPYEVAAAHTRQEHDSEPAPTAERTEADAATSEVETVSDELTPDQTATTEDEAWSEADVADDAVTAKEDERKWAADQASEPAEAEQTEGAATDDPASEQQDRQFRDIDEILAEAETEVAEDDDPDDLNAAGGQTAAERLAAELDLARAYLEMDEIEDAREVLTQVHEEAQTAGEQDLADEAATLLRRLDD